MPAKSKIPLAGVVWATLHRLPRTDWIRKESPSYDRAQRTLLHLASSGVLLVHRFTVSLVAWGVLSLIGIYWRPLHALSPATTLFAIAIGCVANWLRNRTLHCVITGPLFLIAALVFLLSDVTGAHLNGLFVWPFVAIGVGIAFLLEWRYTRLSAS